MDQPPPPANPELPGAGRKVLCIEDEHFIGELYVRALTRAGYGVKVIIDGELGLKEAQTGQYDIILLDIMIPSMTGIEVLKRLRDPSVSQPVKAKIIITTNLEQSEEGRQAIEAQADGYVIKAEMTPGQLVDFLNQLQV